MSRSYKYICSIDGDIELSIIGNVCPKCGRALNCVPKFSDEEIRFALGVSAVKDTYSTTYDVEKKELSPSCTDDNKKPTSLPKPTFEPKKKESKPVNQDNNEKGRTDILDIVDKAFLARGIIGCHSVKNILKDEVKRMNVCDMSGGSENVSIKNQSIIVAGNVCSGKSLLADAFSDIILDYHIRQNRTVQIVKIDDILEAFNKNGNKGVLQLFDKMKDVVIRLSAPLDEVFLKDDGTTKIDYGLVKSLYYVMATRRNEITFIYEGSMSIASGFYTCKYNRHNVIKIDIPAYSTDELTEIAEKMCKKGHNCVLTNPAKEMVKKRIEMETFDDSYTSGIFLGELVDDAFSNLCKRISRNEGKMGVLDDVDFMSSQIDMNEVNKIMDELMEYKEQIHVIEEAEKLIRRAKASYERIQAGNKPLTQEFYHMIFEGPVGTGKSSIAPIFGRFFKALGILKKGHFVEISKSDLESQYVGETAVKMEEYVQQALDGVLFIDEAYTLVGDSTKGQQSNHGIEAMEVLLRDLTRYKNRLVVILGGYPNETEKLLKLNQGMPSRFPTIVEFVDYSEDKMIDIFYRMLKKQQVDIYPNSENDIRKLITVSSKSPSFRGGRGVSVLIDRLKDRMVLRTSKTSDGTYGFDGISQEDVFALLGNDFGDDSLDALLAELDNMIGLTSVKNHIHGLVKSGIGDKRLKEAGIHVGQTNSLNMALLGAPGTCKTTIARLVAKIYLKLGYLKYDRFVECSARDLIAGYVGMSEERVTEYIESAEGGCLFIDEFYSLCNGNETAGNSFAKGVIEKINAVADQNRLMIVIAGYPEEMNNAISRGNAGLDSRFKTRIIFPDYTTDELVDIFEYQLNKMSLEMPDALIPAVKELILDDRNNINARGGVYGNGRSIRNLVDKVSLNYKRRMANPDVEISNIISLEDLKEVI